jgi:hypothetical protein
MRICRSLSKPSIAVAAITILLSPAGPAFSAWLDGVKEMRIGERTHPVCPEDYLIERGFPVRDVPDEQNAAIEYVQAINLYSELAPELQDIYDYVLGNVWIDEAKTLLPWLEKNRATMDALREGGRKSDCKFPYLGTRGMSLVNILLPHLGQMRNLGRLLTIHGKYLESKGEYRAALDDYLLMAKMGYHVSRGPILISGLLGIAVDVMSAAAIEKCVLRNRLGFETLSYLRENLTSVGRSSENYDISMSGERVFGLTIIDDLCRRPEEFRGLIDAPSATQLVALAGAKSLGLRAMLKSDFRRYWNAVDKWNELPDHVALRPENDLDEDKIVSDLPPWSLGKMLLPALGRARISFVRIKARKAILTTQVGLEIYRNKNGRYPKTLGRLKGILDEIPLDPFTNELLKYRRTEDGYIVYSVNENLVDDGGDIRAGGRDIGSRYPLPEPEPFKRAD